MLLFLAQTATDPDKAIGWLERLIQGGVPLICLGVATIAVIGVVLQYRKNAELEAAYRKDLDDRAKAEKLDAEKRLAKQAAEAEKHAAKAEALMRERLQAEKESDATLAQAVRVIEANTKMLERIERRLDD